MDHLSAVVHFLIIENAQTEHKPTIADYTSEVGMFLYSSEAKAISLKLCKTEILLHTPTVK